MQLSGWTFMWKFTQRYHINEEAVTHPGIFLGWGWERTACAQDFKFCDAVKCHNLLWAEYKEKITFSWITENDTSLLKNYSLDAFWLVMKVLTKTSTPFVGMGINSWWPGTGDKYHPHLWKWRCFSLPSPHFFSRTLSELMATFDWLVL